MDLMEKKKLGFGCMWLPVLEEGKPDSFDYEKIAVLFDKFLEQVEDNCGTFTDFAPLTEEENDIIRRVVEIINEKTVVSCTACEYCTHGCPKNIAIPQYFAAYNSIMQTTGSYSSQQVYYNNIALNGHGKAGDCIKCGKCEQACPQHLPIREYLEQVASKFENNNFFPTRETDKKEE